ncbi:MAG: methylenetetrahydrofolate reductase [NAD(P)H] [Cyanobacteria bacterium P01_F01_bin.150]
MTINDVPVSFEFFPPKTKEGVEKLFSQYHLLSQCNPDFFSVTYGAGGSTRDRTQKLVLDLNPKGSPVFPHLSCVGDTRASLGTLLDIYKSAGIKAIVALRGDRPTDTDKITHEFYYANELVEFIQGHYPNVFELFVAAYPEVHPEATTSQQDLINFERKVKAGASGAITQYFYNPDAYEDFINRCHQKGITIPIYPGIMPITNYEKLARFSSACGAEIPRWIEHRLHDYVDDTNSLMAFGHDVVVQLCDRLMAIGAPGFHFYTLNQAAPTLAILKTLGLEQLRS